VLLYKEIEALDTVFVRVSVSIANLIVSAICKPGPSAAMAALGGEADI